MPAGPVLVSTGSNQPTRDELLPLICDFLSKMLSIAKQYQSVVLRLNFDPFIASLLDLHSSDDIRDLIKQSNLQQNVGIPVDAIGRLMFPSIAALDISTLTIETGQQPAELMKRLEAFMEHSRQFWLERSETTRKQTRKSLRSQAVLDTEKTSDNIELAYKIMATTAKRQNFALPGQEYFTTLLQEDFSHLLLIRDTEGIAHSVWIGLFYSEVLTNQYGGNDEIGFDKLYPNLAHLYGMYLARSLGAHWYDMGGYERTSPQTRFKDGYKPQIIDFVGGIDLVYLPWYYRIIELGGKGKKLIRR